MTTTEQIDAIAPGQAVRCTVTKTPRAKGHRDTIARLMRLDPDNARILRRAQKVRLDRLHRYIRGNRLYSSREKPARVVRVADGATWQMALTPTIAPDLKSVAGFLSVEQA
ncbi:MAG: hypothetical protein H6810_10845 [Phycisphaeraceae bacterium]|nr:MAG: hypothetical protein H6810_10845 [Phycisphaeraceae bacterium]